MAATPALPQAPAASAGGGMTRKERRNWSFALIVAFVLGFLLAWYLLHEHAPGCPKPSEEGAQQAAHGASGNHGAPVRGSPVHLGSPDSGTAERKGAGSQSPADGGAGGGGKGAGGDGDLGGGHPWQAHGGDETSGSGSKTKADKTADGADATGDAPDGGGPDGKQPPPAEGKPGTQQTGAVPVTHGTGDAGGTGAAPSGGPLGVNTPGSDAVVARDFRYDRSNLPRYPNAVTKVGSGTSLPPGSPTPDPTVSVSEILTTDPQQTVVAWYHDQLPANWSEVNLGQLTMFWPPDRKADPRTVWIIVDPKTSQTGVVLWKAKKATP